MEHAELFASLPEMQCKFCGEAWHKPDAQRRVTLCHAHKTAIWHTYFAEAGVPRAMWNRVWQAEALAGDPSNSSLRLFDSLGHRYAAGLGVHEYKQCRAINITLNGERRSVIHLALDGGDPDQRSLFGADVVKHALEMRGLMGVSAIPGLPSGAAAAHYLEFGDLAASLSDYNDRDTHAEIMDHAQNTLILVVDGVHGGIQSPAFVNNWDRFISKRVNSGYPLITLSEPNARDIKSRSWSRFLSDPQTLALPYGTPQTPLAPAAAAEARETPGRPRAVEPLVSDRLTTDDEIEDAIIVCLRTKPGRTRNVIYKAIPAAQDAVKARLDWLRDNRYVIERKVQGSQGLLTVYDVAAAATSAPQADAPVKPLSLRALASAAGISHETVRRHRTKGLTDEQIMSSTRPLNT